MKKVDAILVGDLHIREDTPKCRLDSFWETQKRKMSWLKALWIEYDKPMVLCSGEVFHVWKSSPRVIAAVLEYLPPMYALRCNPGKHSTEDWERDALRVVELADLGWSISGSEKLELDYGNKRWILLYHTMIFGMNDRNADHGGLPGPLFLDKHGSSDLIVTGHNHAPLEFHRGGRWLVNPGSFTRQSADETHKPRVYLWNAETNNIKPIYVPIEDDVITREHIDQQEAKDERMEAFVERLDKEVGITISFKDNIAIALNVNNDKLRPSVRIRVEEAVE